MGKELNEHYLKKELYQLIKTDSNLFDFIQEGSLDGMWYWNLESIEDEWLSPRFWEVLGYDSKKKKHSSKEWQDIIFQEDLKEATENFNKHLQDPKYPYDQIVRYKHKDGSTVWIRCRGIAIRDANGKAIRMLGAHTNVTDQQIQIIELNHLAEMSEHLLATIGKEVDYKKISDHLLNITNAKFIAFNLYDKDGKHYITKAISGNKGSINKALDMMGVKLDKRKWDHDSARAEKIKDRIVTHFPTLHDLAEGIIPKSLCTLMIKSFGLGEIVLVKIEKDNSVIGDFILIMARGKNFDKDNIVEIYANHLGLVLTNFWSNEKLKENEQRFRLTLQSLEDGVVIHALDSSIIDFNNRAPEILGLSRDQFLGKTAFDPAWKFVDENEKPLLLEDYPINRILANKKPIKNMIMGIVQSANKEIVWVQVNGTPIFDHQGYFKEVVISFFDVCQLKNSNRKLVESEQRFKILHNASFGGIAVHDMGTIIECNQGLSNITGFSMDELMNMNSLSLIAPEYREFVMDKVVTGYELPYEALGIRKNGEVYPLKLEARNLPYQGKQVRVVEFRDITELKQKENRLIESEKRFRNLFERAPFGYQSLDDTGRFIEVNEKWLEIMGYQKEEVIGKWFGDFLTPEMKEHFKKRFEMFKEKGSVHSEFSMQTKNGDIILVGFDGNVAYDQNHSFIQTHCTVTDITEINIANEKLIQSEEQYRILTTQMPLGLNLREMIYDKAGNPVDYKFLTVNTSYELMTGLKKEEIIGKTAKEVLPEIEEYWIEEYANVVKTGGSIQFENYSRALDKYFKIIAYSLPSNKFAVIVEDVTERILLENQLAKEKGDLLTSQKIAKLGTWRLDVKTNEVTWSEELYKMYGFDPNQPIPPYTEHMKLFTKQSWDKLSAALALTSTKGIPYELELEMAIEDESRGWMWVRGEAEFDEQGQIVSLTGAAQNITKQKQVEKEIEAYSKLLEKLPEQIPGVIYQYRYHPDGRSCFPFASNSIWDIYEVTPQEIKDDASKVLSRLHPEDYKRVMEKILDSFNTLEVWEDTYRVILPERGERWLGGTAKPERLDDGSVLWHGYISDITEEKQRQNEIEYLSNHDYLTNLYNRRYFVNAFNKFVSKSNFPLGLMMIDINGLKIINDAYGHVQGDLAIKHVSKLLMEVFDQDEVVARIGGDEFTILAPFKNSMQMQNYKDELVELSRGIEINNVPLSIAIGYEILKDSDDDIDEELSRVENHLYRHKITVGESIRNHAIKAILNTLTDKYKEEKIHSAHVSQLCKQIGTELGLNKEDVDVLELAGMYHDIGKISIPDAILNKPGKLTDEEFDIIKTHTQIGYQILRAADEYSGLAEYALSHHERWDGRGYPKGLKGNDIPLFSRIINVADSFEAMTADRPYRKGMPIEDAVLEIKRCSGSQFDPEIAELFLLKVLKCDSEKT